MRKESREKTNTALNCQAQNVCEMAKRWVIILFFALEIRGITEKETLIKTSPLNRGKRRELAFQDCFRPFGRGTRRVVYTISNIY